MTRTVDIEPRALHEMHDSAAPPRILDVRTPGEFRSAHIAGSYNVPLDLLGEHRDEIIGHLGDVALVCRSGPRAAQAEQTLRDAGLSNVHILAGGIMAWEATCFAANRGARFDAQTVVSQLAGTAHETS